MYIKVFKMIPYHFPATDDRRNIFLAGGKNKQVLVSSISPQPPLSAASPFPVSPLPILSSILTPVFL